MSKGWIGVDLDGTLAEYHGYVNHTHIGAPVGPMVERVKGWLAHGRKVKVFTARVSKSPVETAEAVRAIDKWCMLHVGAVLPVTCTKDSHMIELWDDRCVQVVPNTGEVIGRSREGG